MASDGDPLVVSVLPRHGGKTLRGHQEVTRGTPAAVKSAVYVQPGRGPEDLHTQVGLSAHTGEDPRTSFGVKGEDPRTSNIFRERTQVPHSV